MTYTLAPGMVCRISLAVFCSLRFVIGDSMSKPLVRPVRLEKV